MLATTRNVHSLLLPTGLPPPRLRQTRGRIATDPLARLAGTWLLNSAEQALNYHGYNYNLRNDITRHTRTDASFVDYAYDDLGQLTDAVGSGGQSVELLAYGYDTGWNMTGDGTTGYFVNDRNQVTGMTDGTNLGYDAHGNLIGTDNWNQQYGLIYTYDAENQLIRVEEDTYYIPYYALRSDFVYDGLSRLRIRRDYYYDSWSAQWYLNTEVRYIYDGRRVIQERTSANTPTVTYTRGNDLSGSLEGAGGIGGMLARSHGYSGSTGAWSTHNYYHADAGGNITCLINASQSITASYRYDPFGRTLSQSGTMANANVYRFSSKEVHGFTGMYYYGFRFYDPGLQRWINRDPLGELGGLNLYGFVGNSPLNYVDPYGLAWYDWDWIDTVGNWGAGLGDGLSFGLTSMGRRATGLDDVVDPCSTSYAVGGLTSFAAGGSRLAYAGLAKAGSLLARSGAQASRFREGLKQSFRLGLGKNWRKPNLGKYKSDDALRAAAGRTNPGLNAYGGAAAASGLAHAMGGCP